MGVMLVRRALATEGAGLSGNRKLLLVTLADFARDPDPVPVAFPSFDKLRRCLGASTRTIERSTAWLVDHRYLEQTIHAGRTSWRIVVDKLAKVQQTFKFDATKCRQSVTPDASNCRAYKDDPPVPEPPLANEGAGSTVRDRVREAGAQAEPPPTALVATSGAARLLKTYRDLWQRNYDLVPTTDHGDERRAREVLARHTEADAARGLQAFFRDGYPGRIQHPFAVFAKRAHEWIAMTRVYTRPVMSKREMANWVAHQQFVHMGGHA